MSDNDITHKIYSNDMYNDALDVVLAWLTVLRANDEKLNVICTETVLLPYLVTDDNQLSVDKAIFIMSLLLNIVSVQIDTTADILKQKSDKVLEALAILLKTYPSIMNNGNLIGWSGWWKQ